MTAITVNSAGENFVFELAMSHLIDTMLEIIFKEDLQWLKDKI